MATLSENILKKLNSLTPPNEFEGVSVVENGIEYFKDPTGNISVRPVGAKPSDTVSVFDPQGNLVNSYVEGEQRSWISNFNPLVGKVLPSVAATLALGPAGAGLLGGTGAAAAGSALGNLASGGNLESALKAAALGGLSAYGAGQLFGGAADLGAQQALELTIADDIASLANQGLSPAQISNIISNGYGIDPFAAAESVSSTLGSSAASPAAVTITGSNLGALSNLAPSLVSTLPSLIPQVQVTGQADLTVPEAVASTLPTVLGGTVQQVDVTGNPERPLPPVILPPPVPPAPPVPPKPPAPPPTPPETVEVVGPKDTPVVPPVIIPPPKPPLPPAPPPLPPAPPAPPPTPPDTTVKPTDLLTLLSLLNLGGTLGNLGNNSTQTVSTPPSDTMIGSTTPQFGPDYYAAVQRYYNAYMPETPRNVAGPLQQWYENKYGA